MFNNSNNYKDRTCLLLGWVLLSSAFFPGIRTEAADLDNMPLDSSRYITVDEIKPGMDAYCLTTFKGTKIEKFNLDVLSVVHDFMPGMDAILVEGTDEAFIHTGPVAGCSGSPVYIDGRLAGALAFGWSFSKDPLYGVTPIKDMLRAGLQKESRHGGKNLYEPGFVFDYSAPLDLDKVEKQMTEGINEKQSLSAGAFTLPFPIVTSGLPQEACSQLNTSLSPFGFMAVPGFSGASDSNNDAEKLQLTPGTSLVVPLVTGDITMDVIGTVTEVKGDKVYAFGHSFLGYGAINLPMATGEVHTVVSNLSRSFKLASSLKIVGALTTDESTAVVGQIGKKAEMIPLSITVNRYNDTHKRIYNCRIVENRILTPSTLRAAVAGAALMLGKLPPDNVVEYKVAVNLENAESVTFNNVTANRGIADLTIDSIGAVALLMNNPYEKVNIESLEFNINILPKNIISHIWSVNLSDSSVKAGQKITVSAVVESFQAEKKEYTYTLKIPSQLSPGKYNLLITGGNGYGLFLRQAAPYKFIADNLENLIGGLNNLLAIRRDKLYCILSLPPGGLSIERAELPDLPATKALILQDDKRVMKTQPYQHWIEKKIDTDTIVVDKKVLSITVEK